MGRSSPVPFTITIDQKEFKCGGIAPSVSAQAIEINLITYFVLNAHTQSEEGLTVD